MGIVIWLSILLIAVAVAPAFAAGDDGERVVMAPMRDGVKLDTHIWLPKGDGPFPTVLSRAYWPAQAPQGFLDAGYVWVGQSTRGHGDSEGSAGESRRFFDDGPDGYDTIQWIASQPWSDGNVAMFGKSYWGVTQWLAALEQPPALKAIIPQNANFDLWQHGYWSHGALTLAMTAAGRAFGKPEEVAAYGPEKFFMHLPLIEMDSILGRDNQLWRDYVKHSSFDEYWKPLTTRADGSDGKYAKVRIPTYFMSGWYDYYAGAMLNNYRRLRDVGAAPEIRVAISATDHLDRLVGERGFTGGGKDEVGLAVRWLDHVIRGVDNGVGDEPPVRLFVMGVNKWRQFRDWPVPGTKFTPYYLSSPDGSRVGSLSTSPPADQPPTKYDYDPDDPAPTIAGSHSVLATWPMIKCGSYDQRANESRNDVLVFSTEPLAADVTVIGPVVLKLHAASSAPDTDWTAKLIDVDPDGTAWNLCEGILRARFREDLYGPPKLLTPGEVYEYTLELLPTANVFKKDHRIRIHVSSSSWPLWDRNPNTGHAQGMDAEVKVAQQTIYHDRTRPSHIVLPIVPTK